ncbi:TIGR02117 family protein [Paraflavitalea sp. CAU 1676]|uniref:TIGR02117 family protein n=1 Tax=Paraflavitalea sp. CAU 1676 TaxID=3032598 RepID=UPI0023DA89AE|nr:TIGR02117 family protein [Paraflavitalea sp. CAU 1676]MDF2190678.1 TIGR02117 family protein [Paraflavitalea sp. CAU 1676]
MKKILKYVGYTLLTFIGLILFYLLCAWGLSRIPVSGEVAAAPEIEIFLKTNGVHTDVVMPVRTAQKDWSLSFPFQNTRRADTSYRYIAIGWGDKGFYLETPTWADLKPSTAFNAAFGLGSAAIHATYYHQLIENNQCVKLSIGRDQYEQLIQYIDKSLQKDDSGSLMTIGANARYGDHDAFYEANGRYSLFHTCNTWTNNALKASRQTACWWTPFDKGIFYHYR